MFYFIAYQLLLFNPIPGGGAFKAPLQVFLCHCQTQQDWKLILSDFPLTFIAHILTKKSYRVRSGQVTKDGLLTPPQKSLQSRNSSSFWLIKYCSAGFS